MKKERETRAGNLERTQYLSSGRTSRVRGDYQVNMELQYEYIDWSDIAEAELSGDQETLRILRSVSDARTIYYSQQKMTHLYLLQGQVDGDKAPGGGSL